MKSKGLAKEVEDKEIEMTYFEIIDDFEKLLEDLTKYSGLAEELKKNKKTVIISTEESLKDIEPFYTSDELEDDNDDEEQD